MRAAIPISIAIAALAAGAVSLPAAAADKDKKTSHACFLPRDITNWKVVGKASKEQALNIRVGSSEVWHAELFAGCPGLDFENQLAVKSDTDFVCEGDQAQVYVRQAGQPMRCDLLHFKKLAPDAVAALSKAEKP